MKTLPSFITALLLLAVACLWSACTTADVYPKVYGYNNLPPSTPPSVTKIVAAQDAKEVSTKASLATIMEATATLRSQVKGTPGEAAVCETVARIDAAVKSILDQIKAQPAADVHGIVSTLAKPELQPDKKILFSLYAGAALCFTLVVAATFFSGWLASIPFIGAFLAETIGKHVAVIIAGIGGCLIVIARFYSWACRHPRLFDLLIIAAVAAGVLIYANAYHAGIFARIWIKIKSIFSSKPSATVAAPAS